MPAKFKHLIEEAKAETFKAMDDGELRDFRFRFVQLFDRFFHDPATDQIRGMAKCDFLSRYVELRVEMTRRGLPISGEREIDRLVKDRVVRKGLWSLDVPGLGDIVLANDYVAITGDFIKNPREASAVQVVIKAGRTDRGIFYSSATLEACLAKALQETGKDIQVAYEHAGCGRSHMPVFDLVLRPKPTNKIVPGNGGDGNAEFEIGKALTPAEKASFEAESAVIRESAKSAKSKGVHKFEPAKWTHPNGHPRCIICGDEEPVGGICNKPNSPGGGPDPAVELGKGKDEDPIEKIDPPALGIDEGNPGGSGENIPQDDIQTEKREASMDTKENIELMKETTFRDRLRADKAAQEIIAKPETTMTLRRIPVRAIPAGHEIRTIVLSEAQGIKALEDVTDHQIATYLFDKTKWTMEAAQAWVDSHIKKRTLPSSQHVLDLIEEEAAWADGAIEAHKMVKMHKFEVRTTDAYVRVRITDPADFAQDSFRIIDLSADLGIKAVIGNLTADNSGTTHIQAYLFDKNKWTEEKAKTWAEAHAPKPFGKAAAGVIPYHDYGTAPEAEAWDAGAEVAAADVETLAKICAWVDPAAPDNKGSYKLPHHHADGLKAVWRGVAAAMAALQGGRTQISVPVADRSGIYDHLKSHYAEFEKEPPEFKKAEDTEKRAWFSKRLVFQIRKVDAAQQICGGIIYEPNAVDTQGDMTTAAEITAAMYSFMERYAKNPNRIKIMHKGKAFYFPILESFQPEVDMKKGTEIIKAGSWWMMIKVTDPEIWGEVQSGKLTGFSMGGTARKAAAVWTKKRD